MEAKKAVSRQKARPRIRDRVVAEIVETLMETAGAAHRDVVIQRIAVRRGEPATDQLAQEVVGRFEAHLKARRRRGVPLLRKAFGEGSRRWMLEPHAYALLERKALSAHPAKAGIQIQPRCGTTVHRGDLRPGPRPSPG